MVPESRMLSGVASGSASDENVRHCGIDWFNRSLLPAGGEWRK
jgi:hypothetical protein